MKTIKNNKRKEGVDPVTEFLTVDRYRELDIRISFYIIFYII